MALRASRSPADRLITRAFQRNGCNRVDAATWPKDIVRMDHETTAPVTSHEHAKDIETCVSARRLDRNGEVVVITGKVYKSENQIHVQLAAILQ